MATSLTIESPVGAALAHVHPAEGTGNPEATLVLGHGAGGGSQARDLQALVALTARGISVVLVDQPWKVAGRRAAPPPATLDLAWSAVVPALPLAGRLVLGGRSAGARVACRTATALGAAGVVALAFPLHLPGRPGRSRLPELAGAGVPVLVLQGERDPFGTPADFPAPDPPARYDVRPVPGADHGLRVGARSEPGQRAVLDGLVADVAEWIRRLS